MRKLISIIGNIIWFVFTGFEMGVGYLIFGIIWCMTIVGIPFGKQCFKIGTLIFNPNGKTVNTNFKQHIIANIIWIIFGGFFFVASFVLLGILWCITIIGFMKGKKCFKFAKLALMPFGAEIA